jgi:hypothetical protein
LQHMGTNNPVDAIGNRIVAAKTSYGSAAS